MINFTCKCGRQFSVNEDLAGGFVQCPDCKLLVDVPYLSDLQGLEEDGTFRLSAPAEPDEHAYEKMVRTFGSRPAGNEQSDDGAYDLRPTPEDIMNAGVEEVPLELKDQLRPGVPKYDPETGELIRALDIKPDEPPDTQAIPLAKPALSYAHGSYLDHVPAWRVPWALLLPANLVVIVVVFLLHLLNQFFVVAVAGGLFFAAPLPLIVLLIICGHYANVIDEVGRQDRDELPGPLRSMSWSEDIWHPFVSLASAGMICYLPALWAANFAPPFGPMLALALLGLGTIFFPAVLLTTATSGSVYNLRPDRVFAVIRTCGPAYWSMVLLSAVAFGVYALGFWGITLQATSMVKWGGTSLPISPLLAYPLLLGGIYLMHLFTWNLGLLYRKHQPQFPWILQQHDWSFKDEKELRALRRQRSGRPTRKPPTAQRATGPQAAVPAPLPVESIPVESIPVEPLPLEPLPVEPIVLEPLPPKPASSAHPAADAKARLAHAQSHLLNAMQRAKERRPPHQGWSPNPPAAGYC